VVGLAAGLLALGVGLLVRGGVPPDEQDGDGPQDHADDEAAEGGQQAHGADARRHGGVVIPRVGGPGAG
jgi:hypothetical protein